MNKNRIEGAAREAKGAVKQKIGETVGNPRLEGEGFAERTAGKIQNTAGKVEDTLRGK